MNRIGTGIVVALLLLGLSPAARAQNTESIAPDFATIDRYVEDQMDASRIPGVALAIVEGGEIVHARGFGSAGANRDVTPQTPFPVGSLIKSFTALAIMQLVETGQIELDAPVQRYLPWFQVTDPDASTRITVRHLLNQTSGLSRATGIEPLYEGGEPTLEALVRDLRTAELSRPVGESYEYSNANFTTAALIVETVAGEPFGEYLNRQILAPLGMTNSSAVDDATQDARTALYQYWFGIPRAVEDAYQPSRFAGEYLIASAEDMARYLAMYLGNGAYDGVRVLSSDGIAQMLAPATNKTTRQLLSTEFTFRYGMGWFAGPFGAAADARWHLGELPYFNAWMVLQPERDRGVIVLINAGSQLEFAGANEVMSRIPLGVVDLLDGQEPPTGLGLARFYAIFDLIAAAIVVIQVWALARLLRRPLALAGPAIGAQRVLRLARGAVPLVWELGLGLGLLLGYSALLGMGWRGSFLAFPDLTLVVAVTASLWWATGVARLARIGQAWLADGQTHSDPGKTAGRPMPSAAAGSPAIQ